MPFFLWNDTIYRIMVLRFVPKILVVRLANPSKGYMCTCQMLTDGLVGLFLTWAFNIFYSWLMNLFAMCSALAGPWWITFYATSAMYRKWVLVHPIIILVGH